jgi:hypothetical protein
MSIDEREVRSRLAETAAQAGPPRFTTEDLAERVRRIRRRRRRGAGIIAAVSVVAVVSAVVIPLTRGQTGQPGMSSPASLGPRLSYTMTVNGQTRAVSAATGAPLLFTIIPGERLAMTVEVTVPGPQAMTALWLGIINGVETVGPANVPVNMKPILAGSTRVPLRPGAHRFVLHWTVPAGLTPGASRQLAAEWAWSGTEPGKSETEIADFAVPPPATSPAAVARRLRAMSLHDVTICGGARPAWIHAVRTTFSKAMAIPDVAQGINIADDATDGVYLVLMKGEFIFHDSGPAPSCAQAPTGHYFSALFDAATFVTLEEGLGDRLVVPVPLQTLGPVLNLTDAGHIRH